MSAPQPPADERPEPAFADVARLYLGNVLYAIERTALGLQEEGRMDDAAFYRGVARHLTEAYGREARRGER